MPPRAHRQSFAEEPARTGRRPAWPDPTPFRFRLCPRPSDLPPAELSARGPQPLTYPRTRSRPGRQQASNKCWLRPCQMPDSAWASGPWKDPGALLGTPTCKVLPAASWARAPRGHARASPLPHQHLTGPVVDSLVAPVSPLSQTEGGQGQPRPPPCPGAEPSPGSHGRPPASGPASATSAQGPGGWAAAGTTVPRTRLADSACRPVWPPRQDQEPRGTCPSRWQDKDPARRPRPPAPALLTMSSTRSRVARMTRRETSGMNRVNQGSVEISGMP